MGINTAILSRTGSYTGYGFAVPVDIVAKVFNDLVQYGRVQKAFLGIEAIELNGDLVKELNLQVDKLDGVLAQYIEEGSAAEKAGLREGDVILKINGEGVNNKSEFEEQMSYYRPGDKVKITYQRGSKVYDAQAQLTNQEGTTGLLKNQIYSSDKLGVDLEPVSKLEKRKMGIEHGVRLVKIKGGIFGRMRNIGEGFVITHINGREVKTPQDVENILENSGRSIVIEGFDERGGRARYSYYY